MWKRTICAVSMVAVAFIISSFNTAEAKKGEQLAGVVNINTATAEELTMLPGIGSAKAAAIVEYRETTKFNTVEDIKKVKGIGEKLFNQISPYITVDGPTTAKMVKGVSIEKDTPTVGGEG